MSINITAKDVGALYAQKPSDGLDVAAGDEIAVYRRKRAKRLNEHEFIERAPESFPEEDECSGTAVLTELGAELINSHPEDYWLVEYSRLQQLVDRARERLSCEHSIDESTMEFEQRNGSLRTTGVCQHCGAEVASSSPIESAENDD